MVILFPSAASRIYTGVLEEGSTHWLSRAAGVSRGRGSPAPRPFPDGARDSRGRTETLPRRDATLPRR
jgi:hypothetical protein